MSHRWIWILLGAAGCTGSAQVQVKAEPTAPLEEPTSSSSAEKDATPTADKGSVTIHYAPPAVGKKSHVRVETDFAIQSGKGGVLHAQQVFDRREEVLAVKGDRVTRLKVSFLEGKLTVTHGNPLPSAGAPAAKDPKAKGKPAKAPKGKVFEDPLVGGTWIVSEGGLQPIVETEGGAPASPWTAAKVGIRYRRFDAAGKIENGGYPQGSIGVGMRVPSLENAFLEANSLDSDLLGRVKDVTITLKEVKETGGSSVAVFELISTYDLSEKSTGRSFSFALWGTLSARASDGHLLGWKLSGTMDGTQGVQGTFTSVGTVTEE